MTDDTGCVLEHRRKPGALGLLALVCVLGGWSCGREPTGTDLRERWFGPHVGISWARPVVAGDLVYFGSGDGRVYAREVDTGRSRWVTDADAGPIEGGNFVERGGVVAVSTSFQTVALDAMTGAVQWRYSAPPDSTFGTSRGPGVVARAHLAIDDDHVYVPAWGASISAVDRTSGVVRWVWRATRVATDTAVGGRFRSGVGGVRLSGDTLFALGWHFTVENGVRSEAWILALDSRTGRELWRTTLPNPRGGTILTAPALAGSVVVFAATSGRVATVDRASGQPRWFFEPPQVLSPRAGAEADADAVYADGGDGFIRALDPGTGAEKWRQAIPTQTLADMTISTRRLYVSEGYYLHVLDRQTGRRIVRLVQPRVASTDGSLFASAVAVAAGRVYATVYGGAWSFDEP